MFVPLDVVALLGGHRGKVHFDKVGNGTGHSPVEGVKATTQVDDLTGLLVAQLLEQSVQAHFDAPHTGKVAPVDLGGLAHRVADKVTDVVVLPVAQLDSAWNGVEGVSE